MNEVPSHPLMYSRRVPIRFFSFIFLPIKKCFLVLCLFVTLVGGRGRNSRIGKCLPLEGLQPSPKKIYHLTPMNNVYYIEHRIVVHSFPSDYNIVCRLPKLPGLNSTNWVFEKLYCFISTSWLAIGFSQDMFFTGTVKLFWDTTMLGIHHK